MEAVSLSPAIIGMGTLITLLLAVLLMIDDNDT